LMQASTKRWLVCIQWTCIYLRNLGGGALSVAFLVLQGHANMFSTSPSMPFMYCYTYIQHHTGHHSTNSQIIHL
jgi:hypothetical protein